MSKQQKVERGVLHRPRLLTDSTMNEFNNQSILIWLQVVIYLDLDRLIHFLWLRYCYYVVNGIQLVLIESKKPTQKRFGSLKSYLLPFIPRQLNTWTHL